MIREYLGNNAYRYTLTSDSEVILTDDELNELIENSPLVEDLLDQIEELESEVSGLQIDVDDNNKEIDSLNEEICKLDEKIMSKMSDKSKKLLTEFGFKLDGWHRPFKIEAKNKIYLKTALKRKFGVAPKIIFKYSN